MTEDRKAAEAAVKAAEKTYAAASKKADDALAKYKPLRAASNAAARALAHAKTHPALYDDDDLAIVDVGLGGRVAYTKGQQDQTHEQQVEPPQPPAPPATPVQQPVQAQAVPEPPEPEYVQDEEGYAEPVQPQSAAPWEQPAPAPAAAEPPKRRRRTAAQKKADEQAAAAPESPAAPAVPQGPPGTVFVGYTSEMTPIFQAATPAQPPAAAPPVQPQAAPGAAPWETGAAPMY